VEYKKKEKKKRKEREKRKTNQVLIRYSHDGKLSDAELTALVAIAASSLTRTCSRLAFEEKGRHMQASDLQVHIQTAFNQLFEGESPKL